MCMFFEVDHSKTKVITSGDITNDGLSRYAVYLLGICDLIERLTGCKMW